jgi:hypothetical protein
VLTPGRGAVCKRRNILQIKPSSADRFGLFSILKSKGSKQLGGRSIARQHAAVIHHDGRCSFHTDLLTEAGEEIIRVLDELTLEDLQWLLVAGTPIPLVAGTQDYNLPANYRRMYTARLETGQRPLTYVDQREWDRYVLNQTAAGSPTAYTILRTSNTQEQIRIFPIPQQDDNLIFLYHRLIVTPSAGGTALDIPERYQTYVIYASRANLIASGHPNETDRDYWQGRADRYFRKLKHEDQDADRPAAFRPGDSSPLPADHPSLWLYDVTG